MKNFLEKDIRPIQSPFVSINVNWTRERITMAINRRIEANERYRRDVEMPEKIRNQIKDVFEKKNLKQKEVCGIGRNENDCSIIENTSFKDCNGCGHKT